MIPVVAIDGPSGAGKSTVARGVADALGLEVLDTGAMYRAVTLAVLDREVPIDDGAACARLAGTVTLDVDSAIRLEGRDVAREIRGPEVTAAVSTVAAHPGVRSALVARQRDWVARRGGAVVEGRDIGTVVFPDAAVKVYLTASGTERARRRRRDELDARREVDVEAVLEALERRDRADSTRAASPLHAAADAIVIDTTQRDVPEIVVTIVDRYRARIGAPAPDGDPRTGEP
jgi:cytidylate kinase